MFLIINAVNTASKYFQVIGDVTSMFAVGDYIQVAKSVGNNGIYPLSAIAFANGYTRLTTTSVIPSSVADGTIAGGVYDLKFSQPSITGKTVLIIPPFGTNTATSLKFNGKASLNFGEWQQENMLRLLENFASTTAPAGPTIGQQWYDYTNKVLKTYVDGAAWSTDLNVESGLISFKDPQHATPGTKYFLTATEPAGVTAASGLTLYPAINPAAAAPMLRVADATGLAIFTVQYNGATISTNPLQVSSATISSFTGSATVNTSAAGTIGLTVNKNIVATGGDIMVDTGKGLKLTSGASVLLSTAVTLRGSSTTAGTVIQSSTGTTVATFADTAITFAQPTTIPTLSATTLTTSTLNVTTSGTIPTLSVTGTATIGTMNATTSAITGTATIGTGKFTTLQATGVTTLAGTTVTTLTATGTATLAGATATSMNVSGTTTMAVVVVTGTSTVPTPTAGAHFANKTYVDTKEPAITAGTATQFWAGDKSWKALPWRTLNTPAIVGGILTLDLSAPCNFKVALTANVTSIVFANVPTTRAINFSIEWTQDATGGRTVVWPAAIKTEDGRTPPAPDVTPLAVTVQTFNTTDNGTTIRANGSNAGFSFVTPNAATDYFLVLDDVGKYNRCTNNITIHVNPDATTKWPVNSEMHFEQAGINTIKFVAEAGATVNVMSIFKLESGGQFGVVTLKKVAANTWTLFGALASA